MLKELTKYNFLVSETDCKGNIIFANDDFCKMAEYQLKELLGKPHNIVRHPDMPKWAFQSLWDTVKEGKVWTGIVLNKGKNGHTYWVFSIVTPRIVDGVRSYISVRRQASKEEIENAKSLYEMNEN